MDNVLRLGGGDYFSEFALLLQPPCGGDRAMAILAAYLDDSGTHTGSPLTVVAGGVSSVPQWAKISKLWARLLRRNNIEAFHMADFVSEYPPYDRWNKEKQRHFFAEIIRIVKPNLRYLVGCATTKENFTRAYEKFPNPCVKDVYHFCVLMTLPAIGLWAGKSQYRSPVALLYDQGNKLLDEYFRMIQKDFSDERAREIYRIGSVTTGDRKEMRPLQIADVIAYGVFKCNSQTRIEQYLADGYSSLWKIRNEGLVFTRDMVEAALEHICSDLERRAHLYHGMFRSRASAKGQAAQ